MKKQNVSMLEFIFGFINQQVIFYIMYTIYFEKHKPGNLDSTESIKCLF